MNKRKILKIFALVLSLSAAIVPSLIYSTLLSEKTQGALMYSGGWSIPVFVVSLVFAAAIFATLRLPAEESEDDDEADAYDVDEDLEYSDTATAESDDGFLKEAYPELFLHKESEETVQISASFHDSLVKAIGEQKMEIACEPEEALEEDTTDFFEELSIRSKAEKAEISDIYSDLPDTLPEGYTLVQEDDEPEEFEEDEETTFEERKGKGLLVKILLTAAFVAIPLCLSVFLSCFYTEYHKDGVIVSDAFGEKKYTWKDCDLYEISPSFFGDRLSMVLVMKDGRQVELFPSDCHRADKAEAFEGDYSYAVFVGERLRDAGSEKKVKERATIESGLATREDIGEDIKKLID